MKNELVRKKISRVFTFILSVVVLMSASLYNLASAKSEAAVEFTGEGGADSWKLNTQDLFGDNTKNLAPGLEASTEVDLHNSSKYSANFYLMARPENIDEIGIASLYDLVDILVTFKTQGSSATEREIYRGKFGGSAGSDLYSADGALLGVLTPSQTGIITVTINISNTVGNEYMAKVCSANWEFKAVGIIPQSGGNVETSGTNNVQEETAQIGEDAQVPLDEKNSANNSDSGIGFAVNTAQDPSVVLVSTGSGMPQTGGIRTFVMPLAIFLAILISLFFGVTIYNQRKSKKEKEAAE